MAITTVDDDARYAVGASFSVHALGECSPELVPALVACCSRCEMGVAATRLLTHGTVGSV